VLRRPARDKKERRLPDSAKKQRLPVLAEASQHRYEQPVALQMPESAT
jgi:hypothetical protein